MEGSDDSIAGVTGGFMSTSDGVSLGISTTLTDQIKWIRELLDPKVIPEWIIQRTRKPIIPSTVSPELDIMGSSFYGQAQITYHYRGHEIVQ
jgi:hypothetical protein